MAKKIALLLFFISSIHNGNSQIHKKIDSLSKKFHKEDIDSVKSKILLELSIAYYRTDFNKSKETVDSLLKFSKNRSKKYYGLGLRMKGTLELIDGDYISSKKNYLEALSIFQEIQDYRHSGAIYENLGTYYGRKGAIDSSNLYYLKAIKLFDSIGNLKSKLNSYLNLGINSNRQFRYEESNEYYIKALSIAEEYNDKPNIVHILSSLSNNYFELKKYDLAEDRLIKALSLAKEIGSNFSLARINNSLGYLYENRDKDYKKALLFYEKSIDYNKKVGNKISLQTSYFNAGLQNIYLNRYDNAKSYIKKGLDLANELNSVDGKIKANFHLALIDIKQSNILASNQKIRLLENLLQGKNRLKYRSNYLSIAKAYRDKRQFEKAYDTYKIFVQLKDSLQEQNDLRKIFEIEQKYENQKRQNEILQLKNSKISDQLEIEKQRKRNGLLIFGLLLISILSYLFWRRFKVERKIRQIVTSQKDEIFKKNKMIIDYQNTFNHDIYNNLNKISFYIKKSSSKIKSETVKDIFSELNSRVSSINEIYHQLLGRWDSANASFLKLTEDLISHIRDLERNSSVNLHIDIPNNLHFSYQKSRCLSHIVNEFITNSFKHAFSDTKKGIITIKIEKRENYYMLILSDNGIGLDSTFDFKNLKSFGLQSIDLMTKQLGGSYSFKNKNGLTLTVIFSEHES